MHDDDIKGENGVRQATEGTNRLQHSASKEVHSNPQLSTEKITMAECSARNVPRGMFRAARYTQPQGRSELTDRKNSYSERYEI